MPERAVDAAGLIAPTYADETYTCDTAADLRTALDDRDVWTGGVSPEVETIALEGVSRIERETTPILEEEQSLSDAAAQVIPLCSPSP